MLWEIKSSETKKASPKGVEPKDQDQAKSHCKCNKPVNDTDASVDTDWVD